MWLMIQKAYFSLCVCVCVCKRTCMCTCRRVQIYIFKYCFCGLHLHLAWYCVKMLTNEYWLYFLLNVSCSWWAGMQIAVCTRTIKLQDIMWHCSIVQFQIAVCTRTIKLQYIMWHCSIVQFHGFSINWRHLLYAC